MTGNIWLGPEDDEVDEDKDNEVESLPIRNSPYYPPDYLCLHEWVNVGFHFDKFVCKKCNKER